MATVTINTDNLIGATITPTTCEIVRQVFEFYIRPTGSGGAWITPPTLFGYTDTGSSPISRATVYQEGESYRLSFQMTTRVARITAQGEYKISQVFDKYGLIKLYKMDATTLATLATKRYIAGESATYQDTGEYILGFFNFPFAVEKTNNENIKLGWNATDVNVPTIEKTIYEFTVFDTIVNGIYKNAQDYAKCEITAHLPFASDLTIDNRFINTKIRIDVKIDIVTNRAIYLIYSNNKKIANSVECEIGFSIPYMTGENLHYGDINGYFLNNQIASVTVLQSPKIDNAINNVSDVVTINNVHGYAQFNNVKINKNIIESERQELLNILSSGVILP